MSLESLKESERVKKTSIFEKIKDKNRSTGTERCKTKDKIFIFNKQLSEIFSEFEEAKKRRITAYTALPINNDYTFTDYDGKQRVEVWSSDEFSDSNEDIYANVDNELAQNVKKRGKVKASEKDVNQIRGKFDKLIPIKDLISTKKWKSAKKLLKKAKKSIKGNETVSKNIEPIYDQIQNDRQIHNRLDGSLNQSRNVVSDEQSEDQDFIPPSLPLLNSANQEPGNNIYANIPFSPPSPTSNQARKSIRSFNIKQNSSIPPPPPLPPVLSPAERSIRSSTASQDSTGFIPQSVTKKADQPSLNVSDKKTKPPMPPRPKLSLSKMQELTKPQSPKRKSSSKKPNLTNLFKSFSNITTKSEQMEIKKDKLKNLKKEKQKSTSTFKSPNKVSESAMKKQSKIGKIGKIDRKTF